MQDKLDFIKKVIANSTNYKGNHYNIKLNDSLVIYEDYFTYKTTGIHQFGSTFKNLKIRGDFPKRLI